jgi:hypothetical protein
MEEGGEMTKTQCSEMVWDSHSWHKSQCRRNAVVERNSKPFCKQHDPEYIKARDMAKEMARKAIQCRECGSNPKPWYKYCPFCGTKYPNKEEK